jgi:hypothetical protein
MTNERKNTKQSPVDPKSQQLSKDELKSAAGGADCMKGPDLGSIQKVRNKQQGTFDTKRPTRP